VAAPRGNEVEREFWLERWRLNQIGFHQADYNARLQRYWPALQVPAGARVFVPLCGKSRDMAWLVAQGYSVVGVELAPLAAEAFFVEARAPHERRQVGKFTAYEGQGVCILCGDLFDLNADRLVGVRGAFDRGALVALPPPMRRRYVAHVLDILPVGTAILLLTLEYDQSRADGPPFAVHGEEVDALYGARCTIDLLDRTPAEMPPRFDAVEARGESTYRIVKTR
jgi:thiopurine S-methyltransferase